MEYLDNLLQLHGKYFALPTHPHRIEVIDTETNITVASLPRYEYNETLFALGDNRVSYLKLIFVILADINPCRFYTPRS